MAVYCITYDLNSPGQNHSKLLEFIKKNFSWARLSESSYAVSSPQGPQNIFNMLSSLLDNNDTLYVITMKKPFFGHGPKDVNDWLNKNLPF